jgi:carboxyl-terminal processing protease
MSKINQQYLPLIAIAFTIIGLFIGKYLYQDGDLISLGGNSDGKVEEVISKVVDQYVDTVNQTKITDYAIDRLLQNLDPHSTYIPAKHVSPTKEKMQGNFVGIGIEYRNIDDTLMVVHPIPGGSSEKAGILTGDRFIGINNQEIELGKLKSDSLAKLLRGEAGSSIDILVYRPKTKTKESITITRGEIPIFSIDASFLLKNEIGFVKINRFSQRTFSEFGIATETLLDQGANKFIIDVRGNPGGSLQSIIQICNEFLAADLKILETKSKNESENTFADGTGNLINYPVTVLIDQNSASASEILAGVLQDNDRATIIGRRTFGKGLVQQVMTLKDKSRINLTIARYYIPSGRCIQKPFKEGGSESYYQENHKRWNTGELYEERQIKPNDSLAFKTLKGRTVYAQGGIYPDIFVPIDTTYNSKLLTNFLQKDIMRNLATKYYYNGKLNGATVLEVMQELENRDLKEEIRKYAELVGIEWNESDWNHSKDFILTRTKAYIVRTKFHKNGYFTVTSSLEKEIQEAIQSFK